MKETVFAVIVAALAAVGFYGVLHGLFELILVPRELATAVLLQGEIPPEELEMLLCEARRAPFGGGRQVVLVMPLSALETSDEGSGQLPEAYAELLEKYGAILSVCPPSL